MTVGIDGRSVAPAAGPEKSASTGKGGRRRFQWPDEGGATGATDGGDHILRPRPPDRPFRPFRSGPRAPRVLRGGPPGSTTARGRAARACGSPGGDRVGDGALDDQSSPGGTMTTARSPIPDHLEDADLGLRRLLGVPVGRPRAGSGGERVAPPVLGQAISSLTAPSQRGPSMWGHQASTATTRASSPVPRRTRARRPAGSRRGPTLTDLVEARVRDADRARRSSAGRYHRDRLSAARSPRERRRRRSRPAPRPRG